jgi:hypothetical protein
MYACILETGRGLFEVVCRLVDGSLTFRNPPPGGQATRLNNALSDLLSRFAEEIASVWD